MSMKVKFSAQGGWMKAIGVSLFFTGIFVLALAYTMALQGLYVDCFADGGEGAGCGLRFYGAPTVSSALYGTVLGVTAFITHQIGLLTLRRLREAATPGAAS
jgi:hypothetical protein